jgi:hypothetical protein
MKHARPDYARIQDPWRKIPADEPVFLIRAQDAFWHDIVSQYAGLHLTQGNDDIGLMMSAHQLLGDDWPKKKVADLPSPDCECSHRDIREDALRAVLLYHGIGGWGPDKKAAWMQLTGGVEECTTRTLGNLIREALGDEEV